MIEQVIVKRFGDFYEVRTYDIKGKFSDVAFGNKHTSMDDHAQGFIELCSALNVECAVVDGERAEEF